MKECKEDVCIHLNYFIEVRRDMSVRKFITTYFGGSTEEKQQEKVTISPLKIIAPKNELIVNPMTKREDRTYHIFTDGGCENNGKKNARGGYGVYFYNEKPELSLNVSKPLNRDENQTNNRAELRAIQTALVALESRIPHIRENYDIYWIWSDSEYSIHSLTKWAAGWKRNGWKKKDGNTIQNLDIIQDVYDRLHNNKAITLHFVKAHNDAHQNEFPWCGNVKADQLATEAIRSSNAFFRHP